jgi:hypothetical protein
MYEIGARGKRQEQEVRDIRLGDKKRYKVSR